MPDADTPTPEHARARFRRTVVQVLAVQMAALGLLGLIQYLYS